MGSCRYYFSLSISDICKNLLCCNIMHILVLIVLSCTTCRFMRMMSLTWCYTVNHTFPTINDISFIVYLFLVTKKFNFSCNDNQSIITTMGSCLYCLSQNNQKTLYLSFTLLSFFFSPIHLFKSVLVKYLYTIK